MRTSSFTCALALALISAAPWCAAEGDGLSAAEAAQVWPRWQGRLAVGLDRLDPLQFNEGVALRHASLLGDYYFTNAPGGGLRATSGLIVAPRSQAAQSLSAGIGGQGFNAQRRLGLAARPAWGQNADADTLPYLGIGYSSVVARSGLSYSADLGLLAQQPAVRLGATSGGGQTLDDKVRELRLAPVLQLGVSYAF